MPAAMENGHANGLTNGLANGHKSAMKDNGFLGTDSSVPDELAKRAQHLLKTDPQFHEARIDTEAMGRICANGTSIECMAAMFEEYADRTCYGQCEPNKSDFTLLTFGQVWDRIKKLAAVWQTGGMVKPQEFVGVCGFSSVDWAVADFAATFCGAVSVPLPTNILAEDTREIIREAECVALVISAAEVPALARVMRDCATVRNIFVMDGRADDLRASGAFAEMRANLPEGCNLTTLEEALAKSDGSAARMVVPGRDGHPKNPLINLTYTSGSSGRPKGAEYRERVYVEFLQNPMPGRTFAMATPAILLGFLPLNHLMGRMTLLRGMVTGGQTFFTRSPDLSLFFEDMREVRPTGVMFPPRISAMMYDRFNEQLDRAPAADTPEGRAQQRKDLIRHFRDVELGGRVMSATTGSAPSAPDVMMWLEEMLGTKIVDGYGSTEAGMMLLDGKLQRSHVLAYKLVDCPELGYTSADKPYPRGELRVKTKWQIPGYYKHPEATKDLFDEEGYVMTGDVMEMREGETFVWIDRVKNVIKLSQGEYVAVSRLETIYQANSKAIHQIYIYGNSLRSHLLAVVVPVERGQGMDQAKLKAKLRTELDNVARHKALQGYEIPRDFIIEMEPFSKENHLITDSNKPARGAMKKKYGPQLERLYAEQEERLKERLRAMRAGGDASVPERVQQALQITLGLDDEDVAGAEERSFGQLGGDSLAAIQFARIVSEACGVNLPVAYVLDHSHSLAAITQHVKELVSGEGASGISFESMHGKDSHTIRAADLKLDRFLSDADRKAAAEAGEQLPVEPEVVLLTGANGFLGRFLLLDLLQRVASKQHGRVIGIVRGNSDEAAAERLRAGFDSGDADLLATYDALSAEHLTVYAGDLAKPQLGLSDDKWEKLAGSVDTIVHNGALVNHAFTYEQLFEPNVLGSVEVMRLALQQRKKAIAFVSSVGILAGINHPEPVRESEEALDLATEHLGDGGYAMGYGCSKWSVEVLLRELHDTYGVPVSVFRCGMILAHSRYAGQINTTDFFTRLLCGILYTGIAPRTFYTAPYGEEHFDGMPIDFVSGVIAATASAERGGFGTYHVVNPHWHDGVSLDRIVDWVQSAGYKVNRIEDYGTWYREFKAALEGLDVKRQQASPLPIIYQWAQPTPGKSGTKYDATQLRKRAKELTQWHDVPNLDEAFIHQNLRHLSTLRLITPPVASST